MKMKNVGFLLAALVLLAACHPRVSVYAPRRERTEAHLQATAAADCVACHDIGKLRKHEADDDCFRCHKICEAY